MITHPTQHRRSIAPGMTALGSVSASTLAVHLADAPWWSATLIVVLGFFIAFVQTLMPQNSDDRVKLWAHVLGHARFKRQQRPVPPTSTVPPVSTSATPLPPIDTSNSATAARRKLGEAVRARRVARKMSVAELSRQLGCSPGKIHRLERGEVAPKQENIEKIARLVAVSPRTKCTWLALVLDAQNHQSQSRLLLRGVS